MNHHIIILKREFEKRVKKNSRFSLRAFSKVIGLHPSALSRVLAGKTELSSVSGVAISRKLKLSADESRRFICSILKSRSKRDRERFGKILDAPNLGPSPKKLSFADYASVMTLPYFALLTLAKTNDFDSDPEKIAARLKLTLEVANEMVDHASSLGLLSRAPDGALVNQEEHMTIVDASATIDVRRLLQTQILDASKASLQKDAFDKRCHYSMTMAIDSSKLEYARTCILDFMESLADDCEVGNRDQVSTLAVSFFPNSIS